ncbi:hypothetical protein HDV00_011321 [Rhizophlyctis rosea]|nr:hypothetical protein HDV00_011321 [Rhizophlyctis rosea]
MVVVCVVAVVVEMAVVVIVEVMMGAVRVVVEVIEGKRVFETISEEKGERLEEITDVVNAETEAVINVEVLLNVVVETTDVTSAEVAPRVNEVLGAAVLVVAAVVMIVDSVADGAGASARYTLER